MVFHFMWHQKKWHTSKIWQINCCQGVGILQKKSKFHDGGSVGHIQPLHNKNTYRIDYHIHAGHQNIGKCEKKNIFWSNQFKSSCFGSCCTLEQQCFHISQQQQSWGEPVQAASVQNCTQGFQSTALVCFWGNCLIWPAFMSRIGTAAGSSHKQDYAMTAASLVRTQSLRRCFSEKHSAGRRLHLEVSPKVSDLGISHRQIGGPHTGRILRRKRLKNTV